MEHAEHRASTVVKVDVDTDREFIVDREHLTALMSERDRYRDALELIRDREWVENALDPQWAARVAKETLP